MPKILELRMLCDENDNFLRLYEVLDTMAMLHFYGFVCDNLEYDNREPASFFTSNREWDQLREFVTGDMPGEEEAAKPTPMGEAKIKDAVTERGERMILLFDIVNDRSFYFEISAISAPQDGVKYPRVTLAEAEAPDQFDARGYNENSIFDDAMNEFGEFDDDESYDEEY